MLSAGIRNDLFPRNVRIAAVILLCVYTYMCGMHIVDAINAEINLFEYMLACITDHNYLIYTLLFYLVIDAAIRIKIVLETAKIRYRTLRRYYGSLIIEKAIGLISLIVVHLLIPFVIGVAKLKCNVGYTIKSYRDEFNSNYEVIYALSDTIPNSALAVLCVAGYLFLGIVFISIVFAMSFEIWGRKGFVVAVAVVLLNTFTGFMTDFDEGIFKFFFVNDYFIFHHGLIINSLWCFPFYISIMILVVYMLYKTAIKRNSNHIRKIGGYSKNVYSSSLSVIVFYAIYFGLAFTISIAGKGSLYWQILKGFSYNGFNLIELLFYIAPIIYSLFLVNMEWENEIRNRNVLALIRYGKRHKWEQEKLEIEIRFITFNIFIVGSVSLLLTVFSIVNLDDAMQELIQFYGVNNEQIVKFSILSVIFRGIEWYLFYVIDRFIFKRLNNNIISFIISISLILIGFIIPSYNPIGKGSLYQLLELGNDNMAFLIASFTAELIVIIVYLNLNKQKKEKCLYGISNQIRKCI